jgi:mycothiol synthase
MCYAVPLIKGVHTMIGTQITLRHFRWDDLEGAVEAINASQAALGNEFRTTVDELRREMTEPGYQAERDGFVFTTNEGRIIGFGDVEVTENGGGVYPRCYIHPDYLRRGLGAEYVRAVQAHALEINQHLPADAPVFVQHNDLANNVGFTTLMERDSYQVVRRFYRMSIDELPETAPALPEGLTLRPFDVERDAHAVYEAVDEAFHDHWGYVSHPFEMWQHYTINKEDFDPTLWLIAYDGDEVAGVCLCSVVDESQPDLGFVNTLAVRRAWRRRGLGETLLRRAFVMFHERGFKRVGLGVDASSKTNAVSLYERAGMHVSQRWAAYRKVLRGDASKIED